MTHCSLSLVVECQESRRDSIAFVVIFSHKTRNWPLSLQESWRSLLVLSLWGRYRPASSSSTVRQRSITAVQPSLAITLPQLPKVSHTTRKHTHSQKGNNRKKTAISPFDRALLFFPLVFIAIPCHYQPSAESRLPEAASMM